MVRVEYVMGTAIGLDLRDRGVPADAIDGFFDWLTEVDRRFSTYKEDSEISRIARGELLPADAHEDVRLVLGYCHEIELATAGVFDVWEHKPGGLDPSAFVKGWSLEVGLAMLKEAGAGNLCINGGGDVITQGSPEPGRSWRVGIRHPIAPDKVAAVIETDDLAIATSGSYERGRHIFDPFSGEPPEALVSMTVTGPRMSYADAYSTAAFAMGEQGVEWVVGISGYEAFAITADGRTIRTDGFEPSRSET